jgi:hypothetical protein
LPEIVEDRGFRPHRIRQIAVNLKSLRRIDPHGFDPVIYGTRRWLRYWHAANAPETNIVAAARDAS